MSSLTVSDHRLKAAFRADASAGLASPIKSIPSRWFYDDAGSELFSKITRLSEYSLSRTEIGILREHLEEISAFCSGGPATIVEYGAGFGEKTEILLKALTGLESYVAIDISELALQQVMRRVHSMFPDLHVVPVVADFLREPISGRELHGGQNVVSFFPGSTIGNFSREEVDLFFRNLPVSDSGHGKLLIGVDLKQDITRHRRAYDDAEGVTAAFNLNLLHRINRELEGTFPVDRFEHLIRWNAEESAIEMHLRSLDTRSVMVAGECIPFTQGETIHTETSRKFTLESFREAIAPSRWGVEKTWMDAAATFAVLGLSKKYD